MPITILKHGSVVEKLYRIWQILNEIDVCIQDVLKLADFIILFLS